MTTTPPFSRPPTSSSAFSDTSFLEALSTAESLPRSMKAASPTRQEELPSLFSPTNTTTTVTTNKSAETNGTGATGSTEREGQATRSLIESVNARQEDRESSRRDSESRDERESWIQVKEEEKEDQEMDERRQLQDETSLRVPCAHRSSTISSRSRIKQEVDDDQDSFLAHEESRLFEMCDLEHRPELPHRVTNSQEAEGLERSVTRSQSDFTRWLEDTMRLARGDGSSVIETDDALSSILQATRQTRFGHSEESDRSSILGTPIQLEASLPFEGDLSFEGGEEVPEETDETEQTPTPREVAEDKAVSEKAKSVSDDGSDSTPRAPASRNYGWKFLSLSLSVALAYSIHRQHALSRSMRPTPVTSTRFVPIIADNSTTVFSPFSTPLPVAESYAFPIYAIVCTLLAALPTSIHLLRRRTSPPEGLATQNSSRAKSPLLELNGDALLTARERLAVGVSHYTSRRTNLAIATLSPILDLACAPLDKALASEHLGHCYYLLARHAGNDIHLLEEAKKAYERSIRLDSARAGPRGGLGKTKYRLGDYRGAVKAFETAISRDDKLSWLYEWLAKSLYRVSEGGAGGGQSTSNSLIESHLERAISLNPQGSYQAQAFLGEVLHLQGKTREALARLERSISLRIDQPQVHARLGFIANERLDPVLASRHFRLVLDTRGKGGRVDESCPVSLEAVRGVTPHLSLYFVVPRHDTTERIKVLRQALDEYPHDDLLQLLYSVETTSGDSATSNSNLELRSIQLEKRSERYPQDSFIRGLYALSLLALGKLEQAEQVYSSFWSQIGGGAPVGPGSQATPATLAEDQDKAEEEATRKREEKRRIAWLVMAFFEIKQSTRVAGQAQVTNVVEAGTASPKKQKNQKKAKVSEKVVERVVEEKPRVVSLRRSTRNRGD